MSVGATESVIFSEFLEPSRPLGPDEVRRTMVAAIGPGAIEFRRTIEQAVGTGSGDISVRAGIGLFFLGQHQRAIDALAGCNDGVGRFYRAQALSTLGRHAEAAEDFQQAAKFGYQPTESKLREAGEMRLSGDLE